MSTAKRPHIVAADNYGIPKMEKENKTIIIVSNGWLKIDGVFDLAIAILRSPGQCSVLVGID